MELYGWKLHLLCSITGGFILRKGDKWPNVIKCTTFGILYVFFYSILSIELPVFTNILLGVLVSVAVLIVELMVVWFNSLLDESVELDSSEQIEEEEDNDSLPAGISAQLWEARSILFSERIPLDDRVYRLVERGFDVEEVFRLVSLIQSGSVTRETKVRTRIPHCRTNLVVLCGQVINIRFDRDSLQRTFARPVSNWHLFSSVLLTFLLSVFVPETKSLNHSGWTWYLAFITAAAVFSLLLPPPVDPYSTNMTDPLIAYTRASCAVFSTGLVTIVHILRTFLPEVTLIAELKWEIRWEWLLSPLEIWANYLFRTYPLMILAGLVGHPITIIHWLVETVDKYLFGICGSSSFLNSFGEFFRSLAITFTLCIIIWTEHPVLLALATLVATFFIQFSFADQCKSFKRNHFLKTIGLSAVAAGSALINWGIGNSTMKMLMKVIILVQGILDVLIPYVTTHQSYFIFHGQLMKGNTITRHTHVITNFLLAPAFLSAVILQDENYDPIVGGLLLFHGLKTAHTVPFVFFLSLVVYGVFLPLDLGLNGQLRSLLLSLLLTRKSVKIMRYLKLWGRHRLLPRKLFSDPNVDPIGYITSVILSWILCNSPMLTSAVSFPSFFWSILTGAPMSIFFGYEGLYALSPPRPNLFYDFSSESGLHNEYGKNSADHPIETPLYLSLSDALEKNLGKIVKDGQLGCVVDDSFFLMTCNTMTAIVHIIGIGANKVAFQMRGLEYTNQTLCHEGEVSTLRRIIEEHRTFGNIAQAIAFSYAMYELRATSLPLQMVDIAQADISTVLSSIGREAFVWTLRALVYKVLKNFSQEGSTAPNSVVLQDVVPHFSKSSCELIESFASHFGMTMTRDIYCRLWNIIHFIHTSIIGSNHSFDPNKMFNLFNGLHPLEGNVAAEAPIILESFRFCMGILLLVSSLLGPDSQDYQDLIQFFQDSDSNMMCLPLRSNEIENLLHDDNRSIISMMLERGAVYVIRLAKTTLEWTVFQLESECVRGFWTNEAQSVLFRAASSRERKSIEFSNHSLRNMTNQSCNQPIGYPAYVTAVMESSSEND